MPYRIEPGLPTDVELRRVIAEQLDRAVEELRTEGGPDAEQIHQVRKRLKKARSALRLARADLGASVARFANAELREVGADLATQRDADSAMEAADRLLDDLTDPDETLLEALSVLRRMLADRADEVRASGAVDRSTVLGCARRLAETRTWLDRVPPAARGWEALAPGFEREYRRGRKRLNALGEEPTVDELHEWRKRAKDLWCHQRLLKRLWPDAQDPIRRAASTVSDLLGDDHDLGLLIDRLDGDLGAELGEPRRGMIVEYIVGVRADIQAEARSLGALLYADEPGAWADRHGAWWQTARDRAGSADGADGPSA